MEEMTLQQPELIGREEELNKLKQSLDNAISGKGSTTFIAGEAGIGKTRLVSELIKEAEAKDVQLIQGWCLAESLEPLMPIKTALREAGLFHLISGDPPPLVVSAYLMDDSGILISKSEREELELDAHIFSSMLTAVGSFVKDSIGMVEKSEGTGGLNILGYQDYKIIIEEKHGLYLASVTKGSLSEFLVSDMKDVLTQVQRKFGDVLSDWDGDLDKVKGVGTIISELISSGKYDGRFLVDDPGNRQENLFDNVLLGLQRLSKEMSIMLFLDDIQWADPITLSFIHYISRNIENNNIMVVGTYRSEEIVHSDDGKPHPLADAMQKMSRDDLLTTIELKRLDSHNTREIIESSLGKISFEQSLLDKIYHETEGNPFFILEIIKLFIEEDALVQDEKGTWKIEADIDKLDLPTKVYDVVKRRLDRLMEEQREMLECASVIGEQFSTEILEKAIEIKKITLLKNLSKIEKTHKLIHYLKDKYKFDHAKIREVLYNGISEELRKEYHKIIASTLTELYKDNLDEITSELAYHFYEAGDERAGIYIMRSGDLRWTKNLDEIRMVVKREDYMKEVLEMDISLYYLLEEYDIGKLVKEMDSYGFPRAQWTKLFRVIVQRKTEAIVEFVHLIPETNELVTNQVFNDKGEYAGYSYVLGESDKAKNRMENILKESEEKEEKNN